VIACWWRPCGGRQRSLWRLRMFVFALLHCVLFESTAFETGVSNSAMFLSRGIVSKDERFNPNGFGATLLPTPL